MHHANPANGFGTVEAFMQDEAATTTNSALGQGATQFQNVMSRSPPSVRVQHKLREVSGLAQVYT